METILNTKLYENTIADWVLACLVIIGTTVFLNFVIHLAARRIRRTAKKPETDLFDLSDELLKRTNFLFLIVFSIYISTFVLQLGQLETHVLNIAAVTALIIQIGLWLDGVITFYTTRYLSEERGIDPGALATIKAMGVLGRWILWIIFFLLILSNVGINVSALIAGLGVTGIAAALAIQTALKDLLASFAIMLDKPFLVGDYIVVGDYMGTVEKIGLKTTHIRSLSGEQLVFGNQDLVQSRIRNYKRMETRRIAFSFMVNYRTPLDKLESIPNIVRTIIEAQDQVRFDRAHFKEYNEFGLIFEVVYYVLSPDYLLYMDIQQTINTNLYQKFQEENIEFAYIEGKLAAGKAVSQ